MSRRVKSTRSVRAFNDYACRNCDHAVAPALVGDHLEAGHTVTETHVHPDNR